MCGDLLVFCAQLRAVEEMRSLLQSPSLAEICFLLVQVRLGLKQIFASRRGSRDAADEDVPTYGLRTLGDGDRKLVDAEESVSSRDFFDASVSFGELVLCCNEPVELIAEFRGNGGGARCLHDVVRALYDRNGNRRDYDGNFLLCIWSFGDFVKIGLKCTLDLIRACNVGEVNQQK